ncbi:MAG: hypothetical protein M1830_007835 [Pleopsidium flavum]|nr:MAG: hypothetical protein M1830_007835 [Pleopsidium flavum]
MSNQASSVDSTRVSYGRGGAGNISRQNAGSPGPDLVTPTIKSDMYTTGRGGTGNMAKNDPTNPAIARGRQDVDSLPRRMSEGESHFGRGAS